MDTEVVETVVETTPETDLYHRPARITRISTMTGIFSWVILVIGVLIFGYLSYSLITSIVQAGPEIALSADRSAFIAPFLDSGGVAVPVRGVAVAGRSCLPVDGHRREHSRKA